MIWHPLVLAICLGDLLALAIGGDAGRRLVTALPRWEPASADRGQLMRERSLELAGYQGLWVFVLQAGTFGLLVLGLSNAWSAVVPGAMCGTGVMQAMGAAGTQTLLFKAAALLAYVAWCTAVSVGRHHPEGPLEPILGRLFLLGLSFSIMGSIAWYGAMASVDPAKVVDCCAVVYAEASSLTTAPFSGSGLGGYRWIAIAMIGAFMIAAAAIVRWFRPRREGPKRAVLMCLLTMVWAALATQALRFGFGPYIYEVLEHPCPWCFFLPAHHGVGFILFGALVAVCAEQIAAAVSVTIAVKQPVLADFALDRLRASQMRVGMGVVVFCAAAMLPVLRWRLQFGGWMY